MLLVGRTFFNNKIIMIRLAIKCIIACLLLSSCGEQPCKDYYLDNPLSGRITDKYRDSIDPRHYIRMVIKIRGSDIFYSTYNRDSVGIYKVLKKGDSIIKPAMSQVFHIIREDTSFYYDVAKDCERIDKRLNAQ